MGYDHQTEGVRTVSEYIKLEDAIKTVKKLCPCIESDAIPSDGYTFDLDVYHELNDLGKLKSNDYCEALLDVIYDLDCASGIVETEEVVYCKDCVKHNHSMDEPPYWSKENACPLVAFRGKAKGREFDYQYCVCGRRKETDDETD